MGKSRQNGYGNVIAGDFNGQVGPRQEYDDPNTIGAHGYGQRNDRGEWLLQWCVAQGLVLANTFFDDHENGSWTYRNSTLLLQNDYILLDKSLRVKLLTSVVCPNIDTGSDHRAVLVRLGPWGRKQRSMKKPSRSGKWSVNCAEYQAFLDTTLSNSAPTVSDINVRVDFLEASMVDAAVRAKRAPTKCHATDEITQRIRMLIKHRRCVQNDCRIELGERDRRRRTICKEIQKLVKQRAVIGKQAKIAKILSEFRGLRDISGLKGNGRRNIAAVMDKNDHLVDDKASISDVFAGFYEDLYRSRSTSEGHHDLGSVNTVERIVLDELQEALRAMKRGKAADEAKVIAEMLKDGCNSLQLMVLDLFNDVLTSSEAPPDKWRRTKLVVIFKKGDAKVVGNYRPIAVLPILYKLFSRIICNRMVKHIMPAQPVEQAAYWKGFSTLDHLLTVTLAVEKTLEFKCPLWLALVDFEKAFDTVEHGPLWRVLEEQEVPKEYIYLLKSLYSSQEAYVETGAKSRTFSMSRGVKQGDPISSMLFVAVVQACFSELTTKWRALNRRRHGVKLGIDVGGESEHLMELRFADDVILFAQQRRCNEDARTLGGSRCKVWPKDQLCQNKNHDP